MTSQNDIQAQIESILKTQQYIIQRLEKIEQCLNPPELPRSTFPTTEILPSDPITQAILDRSEEAKVRRWKKIFGDFDRDSFIDFEVLPACEILFPKRGIEVRQSWQNLFREEGDVYLSVNLFLSNDSQMVVISANKTIQNDYIDELIKNLTCFRRFFPQYQHKQLYGAVAGMDIADGADDYAYHQGIFILAQLGETVAILNGDQFQPKNW